MRKFSLVDKTWGEYKILLIRYGSDGVWEPAWQALQHSDKWSWIRLQMLPINDGDLWENAMHGYPLPLIRILKTPPKISISRCPDTQTSCKHDKVCPSYNSVSCHFHTLKAPLCFEVFEGDNSLRHVLHVIRDAWLEGRYILLVPDTFEENAP